MRISHCGGEGQIGATLLHSEALVETRVLGGQVGRPKVVYVRAGHDIVVLFLHINRGLEERLLLHTVRNGGLCALPDMLRH